MDAKHSRLKSLSSGVKRLLALRRDQKSNQSTAGDWRQHPQAERGRILRRIQQQGPNESIRQIIRQVNAVALDMYVAILVRCAAGRYAGSRFHSKIDLLRKERPFLYVMIAY
jgi:hypothetical protein